MALLAHELKAQFGKGFDERNLRYMRSFYQLFPIWNAVRSELSWTHYRRLLRVESEKARQWYMDECATLNWSSRALDRQINTLYYERLLMSRDKAGVIEEATTNIAALNCNPREFIRDPVILEFLGLPSPGKVNETGLEQALIDHLQSFLLELGKGFSFVARQQRISTDGVDLYIDLVFYNYLLKCFVIIDLKRGKLSARDVGQMDMYVRMYDELKRSEGDKPTVGIILCAENSESVARYSILKGNEQLFASSYKTVLPSEEELRAELNREQALIEDRLLTESIE